jgi:hypothetical protein
MNHSNIATPSAITLHVVTAIVRYHDGHILMLRVMVSGPRNSAHRYYSYPAQVEIVQHRDVLLVMLGVLLAMPSTVEFGRSDPECLHFFRA